VVTTLASALVTIVLVGALVRRSISGFLFLFSLVALLAANELVPATAGDTMQLLAVSSLWAELAQVEVRSSRSRATDVRPMLDWKLFFGAGVGLTLGTVLWYEWNRAAPLALVGAFGGAFFMAVGCGCPARDAMRRALVLIERVPAGTALKLCLCMVLLVSLVK